MDTHNKLLPLLTLAVLLTLTAPTYAQDGGGSDDGLNIPIPVIVAVVAVILALLTRMGSRRAAALPEEEFDVRPRRRQSKKRREQPDEDDDAELYLIERDHVWDEQGYGGEEDVGF